MRLNRANTGLAECAVDGQHMAIETFLKLHEGVFGRVQPRQIRTGIEEAELVQEHVIHGKNIPDSRIRETLFMGLHYAEEFSR